MTSASVSHAATRLSLVLLPWMVLFATLSVTWFVWDHERQNTRLLLQSQFEFALRETVSRIEQRATGYEQMLRGVQALLASTGLKNRSAIHDYVKALQLDANFSGVKVIGVAQMVAKQGKVDHVAAMRRLGFADYSIHPETRSDFCTPIIQREPGESLNHVPLGLDLWPDPVRRFAMEKARDSGLAAISGKVHLTVDTQDDAPPGFVMYLPVYAQGQAHDNVGQRRANLIGWVYAAFRMSEFMASLYGLQSPGLSLALYDGADPNASSLLYRSDAAASAAHASRSSGRKANEYMVVAGHPWTLVLTAQEEFESRLGRGSQSVIAVAGISLSSLLALLVWSMITARTRALRLAASMTEELRHVAQHDVLTNLPNRALFDDRMNQELARAKRKDGSFALIFLDLDGFKQINDSHGHAVGDQLLRQAARRIEACVRAADTVGRIGGDEFIVLMVEVSELKAILGLAEKIRTATLQPFVVDGRELSISCSIGVAVYPQDGDDAIALTRKADEAMYFAKHNGRNRISMGKTVMAGAL
ncbi:MAG: CHASE domain-containing protein [Rhodoferax sp.]